MGPDGEILVLHVDDEPDFADMTGTFLERADERLTVETVERPGDALERLEERDVDCVVSDYDMPGMDGIELLEAVRADHQTLPFVLFTGKGSEEVASEAVSAGATDYLQKEGGTDQYTILANRIRNAVEQSRARTRAVELDRIRTLASTVNQALVRAGSRAEAERRICEIISDSAPYLVAWIGGVDQDANRVEPRASAGIDAGYLDDITITTDETATGHGPGGTAIRERRIAISQNIADDPAFEPWREAALERGFRSVAAVPLDHDDTLYGELVVYAARPDAFDEPERRLLSDLGDSIAHAFHSFEVRDRLREERDQRQALVENAPVPVNVAEIRDGGDEIVLTAVNDAFETVFGYDADAVVGKDPAELFVPDDDMDTHREFRARVAGGETIVTEVERFTADGRRTFVLHVVPYGFDGDCAAGLYAWYTDISERRERERTIRELHQATDALMDATTREAVAEIATDAVRDILDLGMNAVWYHEDGVLTPVAWTDRTTDVIPDLPTFDGDGLAWEAFRTGDPAHYDDVSTAPGRLNPATPMRSEIILPIGDYGVMLIGSTEAGEFDDLDASLAQTVAAHSETVLDRIEREASLRAERETVERLFETSPVAISIIAPDGTIQRTNERAEEVLDLADSDAAERTYDDAAWGIIDADGDPIPSDDLPVSRVLETGEPVFDYEHGIRLADGTRRWLSINASPLLTEAGEIEAVIAVTRDVTARTAQERRIRRQNERLEEFASVVSHDLRNPLRVAEGQLELARAEHDDEHLEAVADALDRSQALVEDLLSLAREGDRATETEAVDLGGIVDRSWRTVDTADATLRTDTDSTVLADRRRLRQLLENCFRNAVDHGGDDVTVTVGDLDGGFYIADDGPGIPADARDRVFEAGYSTTPGGTGFGLYIAKDVAEAHDWAIRVTEGADGGARIEVTGVESG